MAGQQCSFEAHLQHFARCCCCCCWLSALPAIKCRQLELTKLADQLKQVGRRRRRLSPKLTSVRCLSEAKRDELLASGRLRASDKLAEDTQQASGEILSVRPLRSASFSRLPRVYRAIFHHQLNSCNLSSLIDIWPSCNYFCGRFLARSFPGLLINMTLNAVAGHKKQTEPISAPISRLRALIVQNNATQLCPLLDLGLRSSSEVETQRQQSLASRVMIITSC